MGRWPKPAEGSWTQHYPELGTGPVSFDDCVSPEFFALEREAIFKRAWLNVGRVEQRAEGGSYFTKNIEIANASIIIVRDREDRVRVFHNVCRHRGNRLVWNDDPRDDTQGFCRQFVCKYHGWRYGLDGAARVHPAGERVLRRRQGRKRARAGPLRRLERLHLRQPRPRTPSDAARVRPDDHRAGRLSVQHTDRALRLRGAQQQQLEALRRRVPGVLPRAFIALAADTTCSAAAEHERRVRGTSSSTARIGSSAPRARAAGRCHRKRCTQSSERHAAGSSARGRHRI